MGKAGNKTKLEKGKKIRHVICAVKLYSIINKSIFSFWNDFFCSVNLCAEDTTGGIRCADHATPSLRKSWYSPRSGGRCRHSSLADQSHGVVV
jgi:hypothetical protein